MIDVRAVVQCYHRDIAIERLPALLTPRKGRYGLVDHEKLFAPQFDGAGDIFDLRGIDRQAGCLVVVRPDQYIATVLPIDDHASLADFFTGFMLECGAADIGTQIPAMSQA